MKYTLLELTQTVLSSMDSDEINSINDTVESQQVVEVIKTVYDDIISRGDLTTNKTVFNLTASTDPLQPILMTKPEGIERIEWVKYDTRALGDTTPNWTDLTYLPPVDFIDYMHNGNLEGSEIESFEYANGAFVMTFTYRNDTAPHYFTSFDDNIIFFDSYDSEVDSTLQSSKSLCYGLKVTDFEKTDSFTPELQPQQFALLLNEAKSLAWAELKQTGHQKAEQTARRNWRHLQKTRMEVPNSRDINNNAHNFSVLPNFARTRGY
jgi:hypothetical protein